jgi:hypothetical protein
MRVTHSKGLSAPDSGAEDKVYGVDWVSTGSHTISGYSTVRVTSIKSTTTTSTLPIAELVFSVDANTSYAFSFGIVYAAAISSTGLRLGLQFVTMSTFGANVNIPNATAGTAGLSQGWISASTKTHESTFTASSWVAASTPLASTQFFATMEGVCVPTAAGTLQVVYATEVAASAISTFVGSFGRLEQMS